jgi:hypothetical protein
LAEFGGKGERISRDELGDGEIRTSGDQEMRISGTRMNAEFEVRLRVGKECGIRHAEQRGTSMVSQLKESFVLTQFFNEVLSLPFPLRLLLKMRSQL